MLRVRPFFLPLLPWLVVAAGCLESNPQPSPGHEDVFQSHDDSIPAGLDVREFEDLHKADNAIPDWNVPFEDMVSGSDTAEDLIADDVAQDTTEEDIFDPDAWEPPPVAPPSEPQLVPITSFLVAYVKDPATDPIGPRLDDGTFVPPSGPGVDANGTEWYERAPGEGGTLGYAGYGLFYAVAQLELPQAGNLIVKSDRFYQTWVNGNAQPGDPYATGMHRTPGTGKQGTNLLVGMAYMAINNPSIQLYYTPDEIYFNLADTTLPDLVVGQSSSTWAGVAFLNLTDHALGFVTARVVDSQYFAATEVRYPSLAPTALTQIAFQLVPKSAPTQGGEVWPATVRIDSPDLAFSYETTLNIPTVPGHVAYRHARRSAVDNSVQYAGIQPPTGEGPPEEGFSLVLSLHGAGVQGLGQAQAYSAKPWAYLVAPTNRRPFGFDWEEWGRLDGLEALDNAQATFGTNPQRTYVTGHSMGGHGTWQFGVLYPDRFRVVGPSAGWSSFYSYGGAPEPTGPFARARASSFTLNYVQNLANRAVYMIHGDADDNVPISEANLMAAAVEPIADEFHFHVQPGAGHWWDGEASPGADCVDWPELFDWMQQRQLSLETSFTFKTPSPWVTARYSYVTIQSQTDPYQDSQVTSAADGSSVALTTQNVRSLVIDGAALIEAGVTALTIDGQPLALSAEPLFWGPQQGKTPDLQGPMNQVYSRPFCFVYPDETDSIARRYVSFLVSSWNITGNGHACALPSKKLTLAMRQNYNLIYVALPASQVPVPASVPFTWDENSVTIGEKQVPDATLLFVFPEEGHLSAALVANTKALPLLFWNQPWSSRSGLPDWVGWTAEGAYGAGFFDGDWVFKKELGVGLE